jgi:ABC-type transport system involved in multi-copper enzyme maturation permease subunit
MKIRVIAVNTFISLLRNKIIILLLAGFVSIVLLMMTPMLAMKAAARTMNAAQFQGMLVSTISAVMGMVSGFGSLLAAWAAADVVSSEMRSGTILALMARPVRRWEFLLGKYLGVQLLLLVYVAGMFVLSYLLAAIAGEKIQSTPWLLVVYPLTRYAIYSAIAILLVTVMHAVLVFAVVLVVAVMASLVAPASHTTPFLPAWLWTGIYYILPSTQLLSETQFLTITQSSLHSTPWTHHATALAYAFDYALVCFLLAVWSFRRRSLVRN